MSIENGVSTSAPKAAAKAASSGGNGSGAGKTQATVPGDFASLLSNLGAEALPPQDALAGGEEDVLPTGSETAEVVSWPADGSPPVIGLAQLAVPVVPAADASGVPLASRIAARPAELRAGDAEGRQDLALTQSPAVDTQLSDKAQDMQPLLRQAVMAQRMAQQRGQAAELAAQVVKEQRGEDMAARLGWHIAEPPVVGLAQGLLAAVAGEAGPRPLDRRGDKPGLQTSEIGAWSGPSQAEGARMDVPAVAPDGGLTTEMRVAEQVSYWIGRGAQNAELEVEGLGEGPVKVSIELQGQEARVEFRADQAQTRQVLQDSMPHLRELLEREGLVLSGLSVGSSGSERGAGQAGQGRQGGRQGQTGVPELPALALAAATHRAAPLSGRSVDLFV
ncbi:flagellar hook-length control protein FliK [Methyloversatilis sp.]|uniref:flagellar hook-length control protein FliK n=1 Tax=Methyloversatilis sp. TaxID=2569862 RepID=UPI002736075B|nr:flagellar hook-length control protein FliK [Methyloversatilis sp.]MDP3577825.1 flagellar hook-length control protein FliK [Methyloversatilis sp.]